MLHDPGQRVPFEEREWRERLSLGHILRPGRPQGARKLLNFSLIQASGACMPATVLPLSALESLGQWASQHFVYSMLYTGKDAANCRNKSMWQLHCVTRTGKPPD